MRPVTRFAIVAVLILSMQALSARAASIVTEWLDQVVPDANEVAWEPTVGARFVALVYTAMYDAWAAYDPVAVGSVTGSALKGQGGTSNEANKREALSHAAYAVLWTLVPQHRHALAEWMQALGYDPNAETPAAQLGRRAAQAVLAARADDGANAGGDFADTTGYAPKASGAAAVWQPIEYFGKRQLPTTPQWGRVLPFALTRADEFRPPPPPAPGTPEWARQIDLLIKASAGLTDAQKAAAEYWAPWGSSPAPHLLEITKFFSNSHDLRLDEDVKLFFAVTNAILDASIATWEGKYVYDYVRPITAIRRLGDQRITAWHPRSLPTAFAYSTPLTRGKDAAAAPAGVGEMPASEWEPYLPTPSFPAYVSGHSAFTAAWARVMELATGGVDLDLRARVHHLFVEQRELAEPVTLSYPSFASAAEASGMSRIWGGIHWPADNEQGQALGRKVGERAWQRAQQFFLGTACPATAILAALRTPFWFADNEASDPAARFAADDGLAVDLPAGGAGLWRSGSADAMPAGDYELRATIKAEGEVPATVALAVEVGEPSSKDNLWKAEAVLAPRPATSLALRWTSDGLRPFRISIAARAGSRNGRVIVSALQMTRIWPVVAGSARYYEMNSASLAGN